VSPRTVLSPYVRLFTVPGSAAFSFAGWVARLPIPMLGLGAVLLVVAETDSYAVAGAVSGTLALSFSLVSPQWARAMDRRGQGVILRWAMTAYLVSGVAFVAVVVAGGPRWSWFVLAALTGASGPNIGSLVRARWAQALDDPARRQTAFALEAVVDEVVFVVGPPLVTLLATLVAPPVGFLTGIVLGTVGGFWLAGQRDTEPAVQPVDPGGPSRRWDALNPTVLVVAVSYLAVGVVFGAMDVVVVGFTDAEQAPAFAGVALAVYAGGSLVAGLAYGVARLPPADQPLPRDRRPLRAGRPAAVGRRVARRARRRRVPRRADDRAGAGLGPVPGGVPRAADGADRGVVLDDDRIDARGDRRVGGGRSGRGPLGCGVRLRRTGRGGGARGCARPLRGAAAAPRARSRTTSAEWK
jgi:hypothetical protein